MHCILGPVIQGPRVWHTILTPGTTKKQKSHVVYSSAWPIQCTSHYSTVTSVCQRMRNDLSCWVVDVGQQLQSTFQDFRVSRVHPTASLAPLRIK